MRVDFYQLSRDPVVEVVPMLARKAVASGARLAVVHADPAVRAQISEALWDADGAFLANGEAEAGHAARQPILLSADGARDNEASIAIVADGDIRDTADRFERVLLLFGAESTDAARDLWRRLSSSGDADGTSAPDLHIFKQRPDGAWREGR